MWLVAYEPAANGSRTTREPDAERHDTALSHPHARTWRQSSGASRL